MARNRKRAKARQARRPQPVAAARADREESPAPIVHATPDVELAEAQLAVGRPELTDAEEPELETEVEEAEALEEEAEALEEEAEALEEEASDTSVRSHDGEGAAALPARRAAPGGRLITFLQGSWRELQRVQWPDRRQVMQATGVVIGFVIIAGVYLGVADALASRVMNFILTGHFK